MLRRVLAISIILGALIVTKIPVSIGWFFIFGALGWNDFLFRHLEWTFRVSLVVLAFTLGVGVALPVSEEVRRNVRIASLFFSGIVWVCGVTYINRYTSINMLIGMCAILSIEYGYRVWIELLKFWRKFLRKL